MITISVSGRRATASNLVPLPTGNVQSIKVQFVFPSDDPLWQNALIVAVFAAKTPKGAWIVGPGVIDENKQSAIPGDVLRVAESDVYVGVRATYADNREVTTNIVCLGKTVMGAGGEIVDAQISEADLTHATEFLSDLYDYVTRKVDYVTKNVHDHDNKTVLDQFTVSDGAVKFNDQYLGIEVVSSLPDAQIGKFVLRYGDTKLYYKRSANAWAQIADGHSHSNKATLDKIFVSASYAALPISADEGSVGIVTGIDATSKSIALYDPETDAETPVTIAPRLVYNASAQVDDAILVVHTENDDAAITLLPVYTSAASDPQAGGADLIFVTDQSNPKNYCILFAPDESLDKAALLEDYGIELAEGDEAEVLFIHAFEAVTGDLKAVSEENEGEYDTLAENKTLAQGWNVVILTEDGVTAATLTNPTAYCDLGVFERIKTAAPQHPFLYDVLRLETSQDKRGIYHKTDGEWVRYYGAELDDLADRLSIVEHGKPDDVTLLGFDAYSDLVVRDEAVTGESIQDVPVFVQGEQGVICSLYEYTSDPVGVSGYDDGMELLDLRQTDTGMPLFVLAVTVGGVRYAYFPQDFNGGLAGMVYAGWNVNNQPSDPPTITNFTPNRFSFGGVTYDDLNDLPDAAKSALRSLSQCINVSADAIGTIRVPDDAVTRFSGTFGANRKYAFATGDDCTFALPSVPFTESDAQFVLFLTCTQDVDLTFPPGTRFAGGTAPNSDAGSHKLIGCWLKDAGACAIGGIDYSEVS